MDGDIAAGLLELAEDAQRRRRRQDPEAERMLEARYGELREALDWYAAAGLPGTAFRLASALVSFWIATKRIGEGDTWFDRALEGTPVTGVTLARALYDHGYLVFWAGRYALAEQRFRASLALGERDGDPSLQALALAGLARVAINTDVEEAVRLLRQAEAVTAGLDDADLGRSSALHVLGVALQMAGDLTAAREVMAARLATGRSRGDEFVVWVESANLSMVERQLGNLDRAEELSREALTLCARRADAMATAWMFNGLAAVTAARGRFERAATLHGLAAAQLDRAGGEWPADERAQYEETLATLGAHLPADDLDRLRRRGATLPADAALTYALSEVDNERAS
ncbi:tetratricopeptide repeat protein [Dactylosporangium sp. NPDC049525]|uniref:tetratricopeptide repeat protein n=1 Tax=Dactylosporangium sp. NPDC049525 TaxID=3154730 RepID=UPI003415BFF2